MSTEERKPIAVLVHGFNVRDGGKNSVDKLAPHLEKLGWRVDTDSADYGWWGLLMVWMFPKKRIIKRLTSAFRKADMVITHSNGANFATKTLNQMHGMYLPRVVVHFSPALNCKTPTPRELLREYIFFSKKDVYVWLSRWLPFHPWGAAGQRGKCGEGNYTNEDYSDVIESHSDWFSEEHAEYFATAAVVAYHTAISNARK